MFADATEFNQPLDWDVSMLPICIVCFWAADI